MEQPQLFSPAVPLAAPSMNWRPAALPPLPARRQRSPGLLAAALRQEGARGARPLAPAPPLRPLRPVGTGCKVCLGVALGIPLFFIIVIYVLPILAAVRAPSHTSYQLTHTRASKACHLACAVLTAPRPRPAR